MGQIYQSPTIRVNCPTTASLASPAKLADKKCPMGWIVAELAADLLACYSLTELLSTASGRIAKSQRYCELQEALNNEQAAIH